MKITQLKTKLSKSKFLRPIIDSIDTEQLVFITILLGVLPGVADYSLFFFGELFSFDWFPKEGIAIPKRAFWALLMLFPFVLNYLFKEGKFWWILGLLPALVIIGNAILISEENGNSETYYLLLSLACKISFLFFIIKGNIRSFSFVSVTIFMTMVLNWPQVLLFVIFSLLFRFLYLLITQNYFIFSKIGRKDLLKLALRTLLIWSPILLFSIPHYFFSNFVKYFAQEQIYDRTFVERHTVDPNESLENWIEEINVPNYVKHAFDEVNTNNIMQADSTIEPVYTMILDTSRHHTIHQHLFNALEYASAELETDTLSTAASLFETAYTSLDTLMTADTSSFFVLEWMRENLLKLDTLKGLAGKNKFQVDVELSVLKLFREQKEEASRQLDARYHQLERKINVQKEANSAKLGQYRLKADSLNKAATISTNTTKKQFIAGLREEADSLKVQNGRRLDRIEAEIKSSFDTARIYTNETYASVFPPNLTDVSKSFEEGPWCGIDPPCSAAKVVKKMLREVYAEKRESGRIGLEQESEKLQAEANKRLTNKIAQTKNAFNTKVDSLTAKTEYLAEKSAIKAQAAVDNTREEIDKLVEAQVEELETALNELNEQALKETETLRGQIDAGIALLDDGLKKTMWSVQKYLFITQMISLLSFVFLLICSYIYVFSRVAFAEEHPLFVTLKEENKTFDNGKITKHGSLFTIPANHQEVFYVSKRYEPTGRAPKIAIPHWLTSIGKRIFTGNYVMNEIVVRENTAESVDFRSVAGAEFVEWNLSEGEEIVFDYKNLVAMTEGLQLSTHVSLRFTTMLMGRPFFYIAKGPGTIVLATKGVPITNEEGELVKTVSAGRIIAWQKSTLFSVDSERNLLDIYFSTLYLKRSSDDLFLIDADEANSDNKTGLFRFVIRFLIPI